jgi:hypothetical protein
MAMSTKKFEDKLNEAYSGLYSEESVVEELIYLTNKNRFGGTTTEGHIRKCYREKRIGSLLKRLDPTAFYTSRDEDQF